MAIPDPMDGIRPPRVTAGLVPVFTSEELDRLERSCASRRFGERRDAAIIAVLKASGIRLSELAGIARVRLLASGDTSKTDPNDARSVAVAALRSVGCRVYEFTSPNEPATAVTNNGFNNANNTGFRDMFATGNKEMFIGTQGWSQFPALGSTNAPARPSFQLLLYKP